MRLFFELIHLLRTQFGQSTPGAAVSAFRAARAAAIFQAGRSRTEYAKALPDLIEYYRRILPAEATAGRAAELELEWWIAHRERNAELAGSLAALQAEIYGVEQERVALHAKFRAEAMRVRDERAKSGQVSATDWLRIHQQLQESWRALHTAVRTYT